MRASETPVASKAVPNPEQIRHFRSEARRRAYRFRVTDLDRMIHDLANRIHVTGLAWQMLTVRHESAVSAEVRQRMHDLEAELHSALTTVQEMQSIMSRAGARPSGTSSPPGSAA